MTGVESRLQSTGAAARRMLATESVVPPPPLQEESLENVASCTGARVVALEEAVIVAEKLAHWSWPANVTAVRQTSLEPPLVVDSASLGEDCIQAVAAVVAAAAAVETAASEAVAVVVGAVAAAESDIAASAAAAAISAAATFAAAVARVAGQESRAGIAAYTDVVAAAGVAVSEPGGAALAEQKLHLLQTPLPQRLARTVTA